jgi:pimeloyl-ACP methyl ester carboxylesterase/predicted glycosyltransferase/LmbE family N-acetylglucosaminyl deacetylase
MKVVLSPHLDDAVLSCWHLLGGAGEVGVVNVFAGSPPNGGTNGYWDRQTGARDSVVRMRERFAEDRAALALAGRGGENLELLDAQYRDDGLPVSDVVAAIRARLPAGAVVYAPAALGEHPDHLLVREAALRLKTSGVDVRLYADQPHASVGGLPGWVTGSADGTRAAERWDARLADVRVGPPRVKALRQEQWDTKLTAMREYATQFGALERMAPLDDLRFEVEWPLAGDAREEQTRARYPDLTGYAERDGRSLFYEVYGDGEPTILLLPTWTLIHSRFWKMQIHYLARHYRVVTFDGLGNGRSDRPKDPGPYGYREFAADALAVMDATGTEQAFTASLSRGTQWNLELAGAHPDRILGAAFLGPMFPITHRSAGWRLARRTGSLTTAPDSSLWRRTLARIDDRFAKFNLAYITDHYPEFVSWWMNKCASQPHSTKGIEDGIGWSLETDPATVMATIAGDVILDRPGLRQIARRIDRPTLVVCGERDGVTPARDARALAKLTGAKYVEVANGDHMTQGRRAVEVNLALREFIDGRPRRPDPTVYRPDGRKRALFISSPIGLGHARRDVAIARELRAQVPGLEIDWLAQNPVTRVLEAEGERIHPASRHLANESHHMESESAEHDLHCFQAFRRMDEILAANFMVFHDVVMDERYDLWVGDEAWELDYYLHENPGEKRAPYAWLTDFVGWLPMPDGGRHEAALTADYNAQMIEHVEGPGVRDRAIFVGDPDDIVSERLGPELPMIRDWTERNFDFSGYVTGFDPSEFRDRERLRADLGYRAGERVCMVTVGGSGVGGQLLARVIAAFPAAKRLVPELRMIVICGPRIDPASLPPHEGLEVRGFVPDLYRHLAACDLAVVQGGLTTGMELTANGTPFLYFPLRHHFEQNFHVRHRLERYGAGRQMDFDGSTPDAIAEAIAAEIGRKTSYAPVDTDGASRAAARIAELLT